MAHESKLYRSTSDRMCLGVSGGMGQYFNLDPTLVRIGWVVLCFMTAGAAALLYLVMAFVVPEENSTTTSAAPNDPGAVSEVKTRQRNGFAWLLILGGFALFAANNGFFFSIPWSVLAPIALIGLGLTMLVRRR